MLPLLPCRADVARVSKLYFVVLAALSILAGVTSAATITAKGGTGNLNRKQNWVGNKVPSSNDIALWNSSSAATTASLGSNLSWLGIQIVNPGGAVTFNAGNTLTLGSSGIDMSSATVNFTLNCAVVLGATQTWNIASGRTLSVGGIISGSGNLTKSGTGTLTLSGVNTYTGGTTVNAGTLSVNSASALGSGTAALTINAGGIFQATGTFSVSRAVTLGGTGGASSGGTFDVTGTNVETRSGVISGTGSLIKTGTGTLTLSAANTYTGDTYIQGGTVVASNNQALGPAPPSLGSALYATHMSSGTTLQTTVSSTGVNSQLELLGGSATLDFTSGVSQQRNGLIYGSGGLTKSGAGTLILTNANTYTGNTTINSGVLQLNNSSGSGTGTGNVTVNSGGTLSGLPTATGFTAPGAVSGTVTVNSSGNLLARSGGTFTLGGLTLNASAVTTFQLGAATTLPVINITGTNAFTFGGLSTINITNIGGLAAGTYRLFDYTGTALANLNNLQLGSTPGGGFAYSLSNNQSNTSVDLLVSTSNVQWANDASGNWSVSSNWTNGAAPNAVSAQANFLGVINTARTVTVDGAFTTGTITLNNSNAYTIATDGVSGHGLTLSNGGQASIGVLSGSHVISAPLILANNTEIGAFSGTALNVSGAVSESGGARTMLIDGAGSVTFSGSSANTYSGLTSVTAGTLNLSKTAGVDAIGSGGLLISSGATVALLASNQINDTATVGTSGTLNLSTFSDTVGALTGDGSVVLGSGSVLTVGASNNLSSSFSGVISGSGTITKAGTGTLTLSGTNTFGGAGRTVTVNAGILEISADANLGDSANSLTVNGASVLFSGGFTTNRAVALSGTATLDTSTNSITLGGTVSGTGALVKNGAGTLLLNGTNTYSGGTTINSGTVALNSASSLGASSGSVTINDATLQATSTFTTTRNVVLGNANSSIAVDAGQTYSVSGVVSGTGALNKVGSGTLTLSTANTFTGATFVDGTLRVAAASGSALATTSAITVNAGGTLLLGANNQINNAAAITLEGGTINKGNFSEGTASSVGMGAVTLTDQSHIDFGTGTVGVLSFASFDPGTNLDTLVIDNWTGNVNTVGDATTDRLVFNASQTSNLAYFSFTGYTGATQIMLGGGYYEIVPTAVPEPSTYFVGGLATTLVGLHIIRRRARSAPTR